MNTMGEAMGLVGWQLGVWVPGSMLRIAPGMGVTP